MKIWILEDEELAGKKLALLISKLHPEADVREPIESVSEALKAFSTEQPDLLLADIHLSDGLSFQLFEEIDIACPVIFTTAFDEYALRAFDLMSVDYLLKPITQEGLQRALDKLDRFQNSTATATDLLKTLQNLKVGSAEYQKRFLVPEGQHYKTVHVEDVAHFMGDGKFTFLIDKKGKEYLIDSNLSQLEEKLDPAHFFRLNRAIITHIDSVSKIHPYGQSKLLVDLDPPSKKEATISAERSRAFKEWLGK